MKPAFLGALRRPLSGWSAGIVLALLLAACGGGGGAGDQAGVGTGGTGTISSTVTVGPISGFGSVIIAGVRYDDTTATVTDEDGNARSRTDLKLGMLTAITGSADFVAGTGVATGIRYGSEIVGPVTAVDAGAGTFRVLGVSVSVKPATVFDDRLAGLSALRVGDRVEVYGLYNAAAGGYTATRIEPQALATRFKLRGAVEALDVSNRRFTLAGALIDYTGVPAAQLPTLANGMIVRASATRLPAAGVWAVDSLGAAPRAVLADGEAKIEGDIAAFVSATSFVVDGVTVDATGASVAGTLGVGMRVEVEGTVRNGVLLAKEIEASDEDAEDSEEFEITALITGFDATTQRFSLRGQLIDASGAVSFENGSRATLANGRKVELKGYFDAGAGAVVATKIHFED